MKHVDVSYFDGLENHLNTDSKLVKWLKTGVETRGTHMSSNTKENLGQMLQELLDEDRRQYMPADQYTIPKIREELIDFKDFNFELSIIQELMYFQEYLKPKFDLSEFADWYQERRINIEEEGYDFIPEVTQYFQKLPIPKSLAKYVTEINQDGGNDIYFNLLHFHDGEGDGFDIESTEDAKHFPNLKKVTLCYAKADTKEQFKTLGIEVIEF